MKNGLFQHQVVFKVIYQAASRLEREAKHRKVKSWRNIFAEELKSVHRNLIDPSASSAPFIESISREVQVRRVVGGIPKVVVND